MMKSYKCINARTTMLAIILLLASIEAKAGKLESAAEKLSGEVRGKVDPSPVLSPAEDNNEPIRIDGDNVALTGNLMLLLNQQTEPKGCLINSASCNPKIPCCKVCHKFRNVCDEYVV